MGHQRSRSAGITYYVLDHATRSVRELEDDGCGDPLVVQWARLQHDCRTVLWDDVPEAGAYVSTIFVGFDMLHDSGLHREPMLFESAVMYRRAPDATHIVASATLDDAERMHAELLAQLRAGALN